MQTALTFQPNKVVLIVACRIVGQQVVITITIQILKRHERKLIRTVVLILLLREDSLSVIGKEAGVRIAGCIILCCESS